MLTRLLMFFALLLAAFAHHASAADPHESCPTTRPPDPPFTPPSRYWSDAESGSIWYGTRSLWTNLANDGVWPMRNNSAHGKGYTTKLVYWREGFDWRKENEPKLVVTAKRLDQNAPLITVTRANAVFVNTDRAAMMTGFNIATAGCWEISANYRGRTLSFIVSVTP